jgi:ABC-type molybdate transport system ATPase subunit
MRAERDIALKRAKLDDDADHRLADLEARRKAESAAAEEKRAELEACIASHGQDNQLAATMVTVLLEAAADATAQLRAQAETAQSAARVAIEERDSALAREAERSEELSKLQLLKQQLKSSDDRRRHVERRLHQCQKALEEVCSSFYFALYIF